MGYRTFIEWCDSTLNLEMGCDGCELWEDRPAGRQRKPVRTCYAGRIITERAGQPGYPVSFDKPTIFPERMAQALSWSNLTYTERKDKFWLDGYPRIVFPNDMGDTFTRLLDLMWMSPYIPQMENSPHIYTILTKRLLRMDEFFKQYGDVPENIWLGASITSKQTMKRALQLSEIPCKTRFLSVEPMLESMSLKGFLNGIHWVILGFESGPDYRHGNPDWMRRVRDECLEAGVKVFIKQMGGNRNHHGALSDIPVDLRIRELPDWMTLEWPGKSKPKPVQIGLI